MKTFPVDPALKTSRTQTLKATLGTPEQVWWGRELRKSRGRWRRQRLYQFITMTALLVIAMPPLLVALMLGFGKVGAGIVWACLHVAPETTCRAIHSKTINGLWEVMHKGM